MNKKIAIIGTGPGDRDYVHPAAMRLIEASEVLVGGRRQLAAFAELHKETREINGNLEDTWQYIRQHLGKKNIGVLVTGDPGLYSLLDYLKRKGLMEATATEVEVMPGISSLQYLCSKRCLSWHDLRIISLHGREEPDWPEIIRKESRVAVFTGGTTNPAGICRQLMDNGLTGATVTVGENLSYAGEKIVSGGPEEIASLTFSDLTLMIIEHETGGEAAGDAYGEYTTAGIPDEAFIRGEVPMTKEEVRTIALGKLRLKNDSLVYDIGAGTGSVTVECALRCRRGKVYAVEAEADAAALITRNIRHFGLANIELIRGEAPAVLHGLPEPDRVFIGGSGNRLPAILDWLAGCPAPCRVVINTISIESTYEAVRGLEERGFRNTGFVQVAIARSRIAGTRHMLQAQNPVFIISADSPPAGIGLHQEKNGECIDSQVNGEEL